MSVGCHILELIISAHMCLPQRRGSHTTHLQIHTTRRASLDAARRPMRGACRDVPFALYTALRCTTQLSRDERAQCSSCGSVPVRPNYTTALSTPRNPRHPLRAFLYAALGTPCLVIHVTSGCARPRRSATVCLEREARRAEGLARVILLRPRPLGAALTREEALCLTKGELVRAPGLHQGACVGFGHA